MEGLWCRGSARGKTRAPAKDLDSLPFQDFGEKHYVCGDTNGRIQGLDEYHLKPYTRTYQTMVTRGCPHSCSYCVNPTLNRLHGRRGIRARSVDNVIAELVIAREKMPHVERLLLPGRLLLLSARCGH